MPIAGRGGVPSEVVGRMTTGTSIGGLGGKGHELDIVLCEVFLRCNLPGLIAGLGDPNGLSVGICDGVAYSGVEILLSMALRSSFVRSSGVSLLAALSSPDLPIFDFSFRLPRIPKKDLLLLSGGVCGATLVATGV